MPDIVLLSPMTCDEARDCIHRIRHHLAEARHYALDLRDREGWKALGYANLRDCFMAELGTSWQHGYRLINAAEVDQDLSQHSPIGEKFTIPETHARVLHRLPAEKRYVAYDRAKTLAAAEGRELTAKHIEKAVAGVQAEMAVQDNPVIAHAVAAGEITPTDGVQIMRELDRLAPPQQAKVLEVMTEHGLRDPKLVVPLADALSRPDSKVGQTIRLTGHVGGVPLRDATLTDMKNEKAEAREQHIAESQEEKRRRLIEEGQPISEQVIVTLYINNPARSATALTRALPLQDLKSVAELLMQHVINEMEKEQVEA